MTKVQIRFRLAAPLEEAQLARLADARSVYGILGFHSDDASARLTVEYDATRLTADEVASLLRGAGVAAARE